MTSSLFGDLLILILIIINCSRMFFLRYGKVDTLTVLAPISILLCILQIIAWGADVFVLFLLVISLLNFFTNFRALLRFTSGLYVDHYSLAFKIGAFIVLVLAVFEAGLIIAFFPKSINARNYNVELTKTPLNGSFTRGFSKAHYFERNDGILYTFNPEKKEVLKKQAIIVIPDKRGDTYSYLPYIFSLAKIGYTVYAADFYSPDLRWFNNIGDSRYFRKLFMIFSSVSNNSKFQAAKEFYNYNSMRECEVVFNMVKELETAKNAEGNFEPVILIGDWMSEIAVKDFAKLKNEEVALWLTLTDFEQYKTKGYGFIDQMNPILSVYLGNKRSRNIFAPSYIAMKTIDRIPPRKYPDPKPSAKQTPENELEVSIKEGDLE